MRRLKVIVSSPTSVAPAYNRDTRILDTNTDVSLLLE
jgi:hypothetical protein